MREDLTAAVLDDEYEELEQVLDHLEEAISEHDLRIAALEDLIKQLLVLVPGKVSR